jgi:glycosyltransferase involved in cell wall biosynthesis
LYGGTERVVHNLTEELVALGHDVTLFASGDSVTSAQLYAQCKQALRLDRRPLDPVAEHILMVQHVCELAHQFDVIHFHIDYHHFGMSRALALPQLTTLHGRLDMPSLQAIYDEFGDMPVVSISNAQRKPLPQANWLGTVYHGLPPEKFNFTPQPAGYFAFVGRISPEKRVDRAIEIATTLGMPLKIAAKIDAADREYFEAQIQHLFKHPLVEFVGEIGEHQKSEFIGNARALLFPIDWPEPFGLVLTEAMACGTPVVAFGHGSVPEVVDNGVTGFVVDNMQSAIEAAHEVGTLDRARIRQVFEERFSSRRMALDYVELYSKVAEVSGTRLFGVPKSAA